MGVLINRGAGAVRAADAARFSAGLREMFRREQICAEIELVPGGEVPEIARAFLSKGVDGIVIGGGDGTIGSAANVLAYTGMPMGVLPIGTYNHFAHDLSMPMEIEQAVSALARGQNQPVDAGEVNGHFFVNGSSIGAYPRAVEERERLRQRTGWNKRPLMVWAVAKVLFGRPAVRTVIELDGSVALRRRTPFVFVGNNTYWLGFRSGELRSSLTSGLLSVYTAKCSGFWCLVRLLWQAFWGRLPEARELESWTAREATITTRKRRTRISLDGEVLRVPTPLEYHIKPGALTVIAPQAA